MMDFGINKGVSLSNSINKKLTKMFDLLLDHFGPQNWWPGETDLEIVVGAILTQNTNWKNVEHAITNLKKKNLLSFPALRALSEKELAHEIRPAGYYNVKAKRLNNLLKFIQDHFQGDFKLIAEEDTETIRQSLLSVNGIGPETADCILLYGMDRPLFVVDAYTHRILNRHNMMDEPVSYHDLQRFFMDHLPNDTKLFNEFHALIVMTGKEYCRKRPLCESCPLKDWNRF